jgi:hypothetical protein
MWFAFLCNISKGGAIWNGVGINALSALVGGFPWAFTPGVNFQAPEPHVHGKVNSVRHGDVLPLTILETQWKLTHSSADTRRMTTRRKLMVVATGPICLCAVCDRASSVLLRTCSVCLGVPVCAPLSCPLVCTPHTHTTHTTHTHRMDLYGLLSPFFAPAGHGVLCAVSPASATDHG